MSEIIARPGLRRQLEGSGPWVFWRDARDGRGREGFACLLHGCDRPECACTVVQLSGILIDGRVDRVAVARDTFELAYRSDQLSAAEQGGAVHHERADATIDFVTGDVREVEGEDPIRPDVLVWLRGEVDRELLDRLHRAWFELRGYRATDWRHADWSQWSPGDPVTYRDAFPSERCDVVLAGGEKYLVDDSYCIDPVCNCGLVRIRFTRVPERGPAPGAGQRLVPGPPAGRFEITLPSLEPERVEARALGDAEIQRLWADHCARHPDLAEVLAVHARRMKTVQPQTARPRAPAAKVGRNDPCPCGSGVKYKRCCAPEAQRPGAGG